MILKGRYVRQIFTFTNWEK